MSAKSMPTPPSSITAHDLKNQLGIILGFSDLLLADMTDDDPRKPDVAEIREAALIAQQLVEGM
jgi:signal transduction histidine kinase